MFTKGQAKEVIDNNKSIKFDGGELSIIEAIVILKEERWEYYKSLSKRQKENLYKTYMKNNGKVYKRAGKSSY